MNAEQLAESIAATKFDATTLIVFVALPSCQFCDEYGPVFDDTTKSYPDFRTAKVVAEQGSELKRKYLRAEKGERIAAPATLIFRDGEMVRRHFGKMDASQLHDFIAGREVKKPQEKTLADLSVQELRELRCKQRFQRAEIDKTIAAIEWELEKR
jgi:thiol-disulfide isomerase/thioredoxin